MRVMVLGATGFLGAWSVRALLADNDVIAVCRPESDSWRLAELNSMKLVRSHPRDWGRVITEFRPDVVMSLDWAGVAGALRNDSAIQSANLERQREVLVAAAAAGVRRFVGVGSQAEYGPRDFRVSETTETMPTSEYGRAKTEAMRVASAFCDSNNMEWAWARVFSVYGPLEGNGWLLSGIADAAQAGLRIPLTSGTQTWSYLYAADAGDALMTLATHGTAAGIYNIGHPEAPTLRESIALFADRLGVSHLLGFGDIQRPANAVHRLEADVDRLQALGWQPKWAPHAGFAATADWMRGAAIPDPFVDGSALPSRPAL